MLYSHTRFTQSIRVLLSRLTVVATGVTGILDTYTALLNDLAFTVMCSVSEYCCNAKQQ